MVKKVTQRQLREVLSDEIRQIVREELQRELRQRTSPKKENNLSIATLPKNLDIKPPQKTTLNNGQNKSSNSGIINELIYSTDVPSNYYQNMSSQSSTNTASNVNENPVVTNQAYQTAPLKEAQDVAGNNLNSLENTDFSSFI